MSELLIKVLMSYVLGSIVGSLLIGRLRGGVDIRAAGSGNAGGTNALRTQGKSFAFWVFLIDIGKGWVATRLVAPWFVPAIGVARPELRVWLPAACGIAAMTGHIYPLWHGFRGGKGVATLLGAVLGMDAGLLMSMLVTWLIAVILFGFVGLASILGAAALPVSELIRGAGSQAPRLTFGLLATAIIILTHRGNLARMRAGTEPRARSLWLLGSRRSGQPGGGRRD